jgi:hypothetical protein
MTVVLENLGSLITYKDGDQDRCLGYLMNFTGHGVYDASLVALAKSNATYSGQLLCWACRLVPAEGTARCMVKNPGP